MIMMFYLFKRMLCKLRDEKSGTVTVPTALHLLIAQEDDITRQLANCGNYKFSVYPYSILQEFADDSEVLVTSHPEIVKKSYAWRTCSPRALKRLTLMTDEVGIP